MPTEEDFKKARRKAQGLPEEVTDARPYIEWKYLKQEMIHLGDGVTYLTPFKMKTLAGGQRSKSVRRNGQWIQEVVNAEAPDFDMDHVFKTYLEDERPMLPVHTEHMHEGLLKEVHAAAFKSAQANAAINAVIRKAIRHYAATGVITIISDPFAVETKAMDYLAPAKKAPKTEE